jgi:hypothetical protein
VVATLELVPEHATQPTYSSWINRAERWFAYLTDDLLRRSDHRSVQALEKDIRGWVAGCNENPKSFSWVKTDEQVLQSIARRGTLGWRGIRPTRRKSRARA